MMKRSVNLADRPALSEAFCHVLGNTCRIERTAKSYAWNACGPGSYLISKMCREQADELSCATEPIAQHIVGLGTAAILDYTDAVVAANPPAASDIPAVNDMVTNLQEAHAQAAISIRAAMDVAKEADEWSSLIILAERLEAHRRHAHHLSQLDLSS